MGRASFWLTMVAKGTPAVGTPMIVLSRGRLGRLAVSAEALRYLQKQGVDVEVLRTPEAIRRYNALRLERPTGALIHSTC